MPNETGLIGYERLREPEMVKGLVQRAGERLSERVGKPVTIELVGDVTDETLDTMVDIDKVFRPALRYNAGYYAERMRHRKDAFVFMVKAEGEPAAFCIRYFNDDFDEDTIFADELAVKEKFQKNGIGPMLMRLCFVMGNQMGYSELVLYCEGINDQGVNLPKYYRESLGFYNCAGEAGPGGMCKDLTDDAVAQAIAKIRGEDGRR